MPSVSGVSNDRNFSSVSNTKANTTNITADDFLQLMIAQLKNQDFMNPVDDTQYLSQLAQFTTMQQTTEMSEKISQSYLLSLVGTNVTAAKYGTAGDIINETGTIEKISLVDGENLIFVNGTSFTLEQMMELNATNTSPNITIENDVEDLYGEPSFLMSLIGKRVTIEDESGEEISGLVHKVSMNDGFRFQLRGEWYTVDQIVNVDSDSSVRDDDSDSSDDSIDTDVSVDTDSSEDSDE